MRLADLFQKVFEREKTLEVPDCYCTNPKDSVLDDTPLNCKECKFIKSCMEVNKNV